MPRPCRKCLLPHNVPGANINSEGICEPCRNYSEKNRGEIEKKRIEWEVDLERVLQDCRGHGEYDCLLSLSGGKDSIYLLHKLVKEYRLKVLAYTSDFDIPPIALANIQRAVKKLNVDHMVDRPSREFYKKFIRYLLKNQKSEGAVYTVCYFWLDIREGDTLKLALKKKIPLILAGYSPGQPDPKRMLYEMPRRRISEEDWTPKELFEKGVLSESDRNQFWNPSLYPKGTVFPRFLAPLHAWNYNQREIMKKVVELGLVQNRIHANPIFSNFSLNWLLMYSDLIHLGYNPYAPEFAQLIREGKADIHYWRILAPILNFMIRRQLWMGRNVKKWLDWLELKPEELKIRDRDRSD